MTLRERFEETDFASKILSNGKVWFVDSIGAYSGQGQDYFLINGAWLIFQELNKND